MEKYIVFWFPTIFHQPLTIKKSFIENDEEGSDGYFDISDNSEKGHPDDAGAKYFVKFSIKESEKEIIITVFSKIVNKDDKGNPVFFEVELRSINEQVRRNGFVQFKFSVENILSIENKPISNESKQAFENSLPQAIYQKIKEFYHVHECNSKEKDSALVPKITIKQINLEDDDNDALIGFLRDFETLFKLSAETISRCNKEVEILVEQFERIRYVMPESEAELLTIMKEKINKYIDTLNKLCSDVTIEYVYCKTLLTSRHNKTCKYDFVDETSNKNRICALNIRNTIRYVETIKYKNQHRQIRLLRFLTEEIKDVTKKVDKSLNSSERWTWFAVLLTTYGVSLAFIFGLIIDKAMLFNHLLISSAIFAVLSITIVFFLSKLKRVFSKKN